MPKKFTIFFFFWIELKKEQYFVFTVINLQKKSPQLHSEILGSKLKEEEEGSCFLVPWSHQMMLCVSGNEGTLVSIVCRHNSMIIKCLCFMTIYSWESIHIGFLIVTTRFRRNFSPIVFKFFCAESSIVTCLVCLLLIIRTNKVVRVNAWLRLIHLKLLFRRKTTRIECKLSIYKRMTH